MNKIPERFKRINIGQDVFAEEEPIYTWVAEESIHYKRICHLHPAFIGGRRCFVLKYFIQKKAGRPYEETVSIIKANGPDLKDLVWRRAYDLLHVLLKIDDVYYIPKLTISSSIFPNGYFDNGVFSVLVGTKFLCWADETNLNGERFETTQIHTIYPAYTCGLFKFIYECSCRDRKNAVRGKFERVLDLEEGIDILFEKKAFDWIWE